MLRSLNEAVVFDESGRILARSGLTFSLEFGPIPEWAMREAEAGDVAIVTGHNDDRVRALVRLDQFPDAYLYVGQLVEPQVLAHMKQTQGAVSQYERLEGQRSQFQIAVRVDLPGRRACCSCSARVWVGINFATRDGAADRRGWSRRRNACARAILSARVPEGDEDEEFGSLSRAFNRMTDQLQSQQRELIEANRQLDQRRRFTETVLSGVSAGVIGLDAARHAQPAEPIGLAAARHRTRPAHRARTSPRSCRKWPS